MKKLIIVCDDAGFASVDRGIRTLVDRTNVPICADYLIEKEGAVMRAKAMMTNPCVSIGLHFELSGISDVDRVALTKDLKIKGTTLGEQASIRQMVAKDARRQLALFRDTLGKDPVHIGTHGNFNVDRTDVVMPWWNDLMNELFDGHIPPMQLAHPHVRHNMTSWFFDPTKRNALTPDEFELLLQEQTSDIVEFVMHPALPEPSDASLDMKFSAEMRVRDLEAAIAIINSGCIGRAGFEIVPVASLRK